ncbi:hypothetical protein Rcae01_06814 [Novipirellula caenicola]|uniref:Uncharacterized protein n=1 Tax=Novipirellula caenicola TaxID=1536901 RepID=A0ABP9W1Q2_9BACT
MFKALVQEGRWNALKIQRSPREFTKGFAFLSRDHRTDDGGGDGPGVPRCSQQLGRIVRFLIVCQCVCGPCFSRSAQTVCDRTPGDASFLTVRTIVSCIV